MKHDGRVTKAVKKIETGNGLESKPWRGGSRKCPDLDGGIATDVDASIGPFAVAGPSEMP